MYKRTCRRPDTRAERPTPDRHRFCPQSRRKRRRLSGLWLPALSFWLSASLSAAPEGAILPIHYADPEAIEQALNRLYGDQLVVARVDNQLILRPGRETDATVVEAASQLVAELDIPRQTLRLTLSRNPPPAVNEGKPIEYRAGGQTDSWHAQVESGATLILQRSRVETRPEAAGWGWATFTELPVDNDHLQLQLFAKGETVRVIYHYRHRDDADRQTAASTVTAPLGQWIQLLGEPIDAAAGRVRHYRTSDKDMQQLWLLVEAINSAPQP